MLTNHLKEQSTRSQEFSQRNSFKFLMKNEPLKLRIDSLILLHLGHGQVLKQSELLLQVYPARLREFQSNRRNHMLLC